jgi:hypothetical protein
VPSEGEVERVGVCDRSSRSSKVDGCTLWCYGASTSTTRGLALHSKVLVHIVSFVQLQAVYVLRFCIHAVYMYLAFHSSFP